MTVELPRPCPWPEPITLDQFIAFTPEKLELASGYGAFGAGHTARSD